MKRLILYVFLLLSVTAYSQNYEVYAGTVISEDKSMNENYMLGANFIIKTNQHRKYLNNVIFGFEHSAFQSGVITVEGTIEQVLPQTDCNCSVDNLGEFVLPSYSYHNQVRGVSLNFGVEIYNNWYIMSGVTNYQHIQKVNNQKVAEYRTMQIDAGIKYFIKTKNWYFSPMVKFNPETISFGLGLSYYKH